MTTQPPDSNVRYLYPDRSHHQLELPDMPALPDHPTPEQVADWQATFRDAMRRRAEQQHPSTQRDMSCAFCHDLVPYPAEWCETHGALNADDYPTPPSCAADPDACLLRALYRHGGAK